MIATSFDESLYWRVPVLTNSKLNHKVMLIDDCLDSLNLMQAYLKLNSIGEVSSYQNEENALCQFHLDSPDLLIIDYNLANSKGTTIAQVLDGMCFRFTPIIFISSTAKEEINFKGIDNPYVYFTPKPLNQKTFIKKVMNALNYF